jgi:hypothetical protein
MSVFSRRFFRRGEDFNKHIARSASGSDHFASFEDTQSCWSWAIYSIEAALIGEEKMLTGAGVGHRGSRHGERGKRILEVMNS